jgi:hypothetical protein
MSPARRTIAPFGLAALAALASLACKAGGVHAGGAAGIGETGGAGGAGGPDGAAGASVAADGGAPDLAPAGCTRSPAPLRGAGVTLTLTIAPTLGGKPFVYGQPNQSGAGAPVTPLDFRFYLSHAALVTASGARVPVDVVTAGGGVAPYDLHFFNAEDPTTQTLRVLAPPGSYAGVSFTLGVDDACNSSTLGRASPLDAASQMVWPPPFGYLFLRLETSTDHAVADAAADAATDAAASAATDAAAEAAADAGAPAIPPAIHMGGLPGQLFAPTVTAPGALTLAAGVPQTRTLSLDVGALFSGAQGSPDPKAKPFIFPDPEVQIGEVLREHAPSLALFSLLP